MTDIKKGDIVEIQRTLTGAGGMIVLTKGKLVRVTDVVKSFSILRVIELKNPYKNKGWFISAEDVTKVEKLERGPNNESV